MTILTDDKPQAKQSTAAGTAVSRPAPSPAVKQADKAAKRPFPGLNEMSLDQLNDLLFG